MRFFMRIRVLLLLILLTVSTESFSGSYFTMNRVGNVLYQTQADFSGRGGTGIGVLDRRSINTLNPAGLAVVDLTRFTGHFIHESIDIKTQSATALSNYSNFGGVNISIPLMVDKFVISLGIRPISQFDFETESEGELSTGNRYVRSVVNEGGLNQVTLGAGFGYKKKVFAGFYFNHNFGRIEENWKVDFVSDLFIDTSDKLLSTIWGQNFTFGTMIRVTDDFTVGGMLTTGVNLNMNNHIEYTFGKSTETIEQTMKFPHAWGMGASYLLKRRLRVSADYFNQPWSGIEIADQSNLPYNDMHTISSGIEYIPFGKIYRGFYKKLTYRIGFNYTTLPYVDDNGNDLTEYFGTVGLGVPFYSGRGRIDLAFNFGKRGDIGSNSAEESVYRFLISVSGAEKWFFRPE